MCNCHIVNLFPFFFLSFSLRLIKDKSLSDVAKSAITMQIYF